MTEINHQYQIPGTQPEYISNEVELVGVPAVPEVFESEAQVVEAIAIMGGWIEHARKNPGSVTTDKRAA